MGPDSGSSRAPLLRQGSGRYILLGFFWVLWGIVFLLGLSRTPSMPLKITIIGPPVLNQDLVTGWVTRVPFRTLPYLDRDHLESLRKSHAWIESVSEKRLPGLGRVVRVHVWNPVALLRPAYGLMAFQVPPPKAHPSRVSYLNERGLSLLGRAYQKSESLPQVIVRFPLTREVGLRLVKTIRTVEDCHSKGAPSGQWFSLNGPHEVRFYPGHNLPILLLGTDLGCTPFTLFRDFMKHSEKLFPGRLPEGIDLRFSGMLLLRPTLETPPRPPNSPSPKAIPS